METGPKRKTLLFALALCIVLPVIFAETLAAASLDHDCIMEESCRLCLYIESAHHFLKALKPAAGNIVYDTANGMFPFPEACTGCANCPYSPIALKVRLNT